MSDERFDLTYRGELLPGTDPDQAKHRLASAFRLSDTGAERLFTGRPVVVKRNADADTRARYEQVFAQAGAVLVVVPVSTPVPAPGVSGGLAREQPESSDTQDEHRTVPLGPLAIATDNGFLEPLRTVDLDAFDTSGLSLVSGNAWSLEDCQALPTAIPMPDIGHLRLEDMAATTPQRDPDDPPTQP
jgi:hypothetical protein